MVRRCLTCPTILRPEKSVWPAGWVSARVLANRGTNLLLLQPVERRAGLRGRRARARQRPGIHFPVAN